MLQEAQTGAQLQPRGLRWEVGGKFKKEKTYVYLWLTDVDVWWKPTQYCKEIILQLKINQFIF